MWCPIQSKGSKSKQTELTYDKIAQHFAATRQTVWPPTNSFLLEVSPCRLGDLGCGNGRGILRSLELGCTVVALDSSRRQLDVAKEAVEATGSKNKVEFHHGDLSSLPLRESSLDNAIMIAALHHLDTADSRIGSLNEIHRCLVIGGKVQISVWTWDQERFRDTYLGRIRGRIPKKEWDGESPGDFIVPWRKGRYAQRFYHLYGPGELEEEIERSDLKLLRSYFDGRNHWAECVKSRS